MGLLEETTAPISISTLFLLVKTSRRLDLGMYKFNNGLRNDGKNWTKPVDLLSKITSFKYKKDSAL